VTTDIEEALDGVDIILICVPAYGIELFGKTCIPHLKDGQTVIFHGKGGHTLTFTQLAKKLGVKLNVVLGETHTAPYSSRLTAPGQVHIFFGWNRRLLSAAFPATDTDRFIALLKKLYPTDLPFNYEIVPAENVLSVLLCDLNAVVHPLPLMFNLGLLEAPEGFKLYKQGRSESITKIRNAVEQERLTVMAGLSLKPVPIDEVHDNPAPPEYKKLIEEQSKQFYDFAVVHSMKERFITEDVPYGLVTIAALADMVGVETPITDAVIHLANTINETDYEATGRKPEHLGLAGLSLYQILKYVETGDVPT
jgi:opine dehydrogenase